MCVLHHQLWHAVLLTSAATSNDNIFVTLCWSFGCLLMSIPVPLAGCLSACLLALRQHGGLLLLLLLLLLRNVGSFGGACGQSDAVSRGKWP